MNIATDILFEHPVATAFGAAGLTCQLIWPLFSARREILSVQMGIGANYGAQYALLDAWSGAGVCALGATQTLVALIAGERRWLRWLGLMFLPLVFGISFLTWAGPSSFFALAACTLVMIARLQKDTLRMRAIMLAAAPFGIGYDLTVGAAPALAGAVLSAVIGASVLYREWRASRRPAGNQVPERLRDEGTGHALSRARRHVLRLPALIQDARPIFSRPDRRQGRDIALLTSTA